jgi:nucleoporin GLE1
MVDPSSLVVTVPEPVEGAVNNGAQLPSLFLYLLNMFSKAVISQLINAAASPGKLADPLGLITMQVFCRTAFLWRGQKLIDILLAKYRVLCPILFGVCGSDKTEEGRARIGWRRVNGQWAMEQDHFCQMAGLGGGWASMSLRNFKHSISPLPPSNYWQTMGSIVGTAPSDRTSSHYVVLKAMIENFEEKFLVMYGNAAKAALKVALIEFPSQATEVTSSVNALKVMVDLIEKDQHLRL